jgi:hypothetical protein
MTHVLQPDQYRDASKLHMDARPLLEEWRSKMKTLIAALALLSLAASPVFAQSYIPPQDYTLNPNSPALTGGSSLGDNQRDHAN